MENIQSRVNKLTNISEYRFKADTIKNVLLEFKEELKKANFEKAISIDKKKHPVFIEPKKLIENVDKYLENNKFCVKFTPENIIDGYGNIAVSYNGNPYITLSLALMALRTHNNIVFFSQKYYAINSIIIQSLNNACKKQKYVDEIGIIEFSDEEKIVQNQSLFDRMIYIGDKREFLKMKRKVSLPIIYNGYNYIDVYVESKEFKELLLDIDKFANQNDITVNYFDNTSHDETFKFINKYEVSDCFVLFSKNTDTIYKFMSQIRVNRFYINQNPFIDYKFEFDEKDLVYNKKIFLKKI